MKNKTKKLLDLIASQPNSVFQVVDDIAARNFLLELNYNGVFSNNGITQEPIVQICGCDSNPTHIIVIFLFSGHPSKTENGYMITCVPRSARPEGFSAEDFIKQQLPTKGLSGFRVVRRAPPKEGHN